MKLILITIGTILLGLVVLAGSGSAEDLDCSDPANAAAPECDPTSAIVLTSPEDGDTLAPGATVNWTAAATCTGPTSGAVSCANSGSSNGGAVPDGYTVNLVGPTDTCSQSASPILDTETTTGGSAGDSFAAPAVPGTYSYHADHPTQSGIGGTTNPWSNANSNCISIIVEEQSEASVDVEKTATTTWTVECTWTVDKTGPESIRVSDKLGGTATIEYNVNVDADCEEEISVSGTITVTNTGETDVHVNTISDELGGTLDCDPDLPADLEPEESIVCTYTVDLDSADDTTNTATANWDDPDEVNHDTDSDAVDVDFPDDPEVTNGCVSVEDDTTGETLDEELCYTDVPDGGVDYSVSIEVDQDDCGTTFTNTASVVGEEGDVLDSDDAATAVVCLGRTMGYWGNTNGQARIIANGGYAVNAVAIGRGSLIDTSAESLKVLPSTLNACGKGAPFIFTVGAQTATANCTRAAGVNIGTLNTAAGQTLALGYNILLVTGYSGQTIGALGCTPVGSLTAANTVNDAFAAAVALIDGSASGGTTTQAQLGAMNTLLNCLNQEV